MDDIEMRTTLAVQLLGEWKYEGGFGGGGGKIHI